MDGPRHTPVVPGSRGATGTPPRAGLRPSAQTLALLGALAAFGPLTVDLYLPGLPALAHDLRTSVGSAQLTLTACVLGLAIGQLVIGPICDAVGRRGPLLLGLAAFAATSAGCAFAGSIASLTVLRAGQGLAGAAGITLARAMVRDSFSGLEVARIFSSIAAIVAVTPIIAPPIGGLLLLVGSWRVLFLLLAGVGVTLLALCTVWTTETLPRERRRGGGLRDALRSYRTLLADRPYLSYTIPNALATIVLFSFLSASSFVYQDVFGLSPQVYGIVFGINGVALVSTNIANRRLLGRVTQQRLFRIGLWWLGAGGCAVAVAAVAGAGALAVVPLVWVACAGLGFVTPNAAALALEEHRARAGAAAGLMGLAQFTVGAAVPPVVGAIGASAVTMGAVMAAGGVLPIVAHRLLR